MAGITMSPQLRESPETAKVQLGVAGGAGSGSCGAGGGVRAVGEMCFERCPWACEQTAREARTTEIMPAQIRARRSLMGVPGGNSPSCLTSRLLSPERQGMPSDGAPAIKRRVELARQRIRWG